MDFEELTVGAVMSKSVISIAPEATLEDAARQMRDSGETYCIVIAEGDSRPLGVVTAKDVTQPTLLEEPRMLSALRVQDAMTRPPVTVPRHMTVMDCVRLMRMTGVRRVPVVHGDDVVGVLGFHDVLNQMVGSGKGAKTAAH